MNDIIRVSVRDRRVAALRELVEALDRRVAPVERLGELGIAHDASELRKEAVARIQELTGTPERTRDMREAERAGAVLADDGGPLESR